MLQTCVVVAHHLVVVSYVRVRACQLLIPVWHTVLVSVEVGSAAHLWPYLKAGVFICHDVVLMVYLTLDARAAAHVGVCSVNGLANHAYVLVVAHRTYGTCRRCYNLKRLLGRVYCGV